MGRVDSALTNISLNIASEQDLGTLTWAGGGDPAGTITKKYRWVQTGPQVTMWFRITATVAGTLTTAVSFPLPTDMPTPAIFSTQASTQEVAFGQGAIAGAGTLAAAAVNNCVLRKNGGGTYEVDVLCVALAATFVYGTINYLA